MTLNRFFVIAFTFLSGFTLTFAQKEFIPPENDLNLQSTYLETLKVNKLNIKRTLSGEYRKPLKKFYDAKFLSTYLLAEKEHFLFYEDWNNYIEGLQYNIQRSNIDYDIGSIQTVLSNYFWPNAYSIGEGTIVINTGLIPYLKNEEQLAFVLCHEFAHFLLGHAERHHISLLEELDSDELQNQLDEIGRSEYYQTSQLKELLKAKLYETRRHTRSFEQEADSLGLVLYKNAGYDINNALSTLQMLDRLSDSVTFDLDIQSLTNSKIPEEESNGVRIASSNTRDSWLDLDSIKTHPDCSKRFNVLAEANGVKENFENFKTEMAPSKSFTSFQNDISYYLIECYVRYRRLDMAILTLWEWNKNGDSNEYVQKSIFHVLADIVYARKKHHIGSVVSSTNDQMPEAMKELNSLVSKMRYKDFIKVFEPLAMSYYKESYVDEKSFYSLIKLAYAKGDAEGVKYYKSEYFVRFNSHTGKYFKEIKYLQ